VRGAFAEGRGWGCLQCKAFGSSSIVADVAMAMSFARGWGNLWVMFFHFVAPPPPPPDSILSTVPLSTHYLMGEADVSTFR